VNVPKILGVAPHLSHEELIRRFHACSGSDEKLRWQAILLKFEGRRSPDIADVCKRREDWVRRTVRDYNAGGPDAVADKRAHNGKPRMISELDQQELRKAILEPAPDGGVWDSPRVARWIAERTGNATVTPRTGWAYLRRLGFSRLTPRPKHPDADEKAQEAFKKGGSKPA
jgi:transposase